MVYRSHHDALLERIAQLTEQVEAREAPLTALLEAELEPPLRERLQACRDRGAPDGPDEAPKADEQQAARRVAALEEHLAVLEAIHRQAPDLERAYNALPAAVDRALLGEPKRLPWLAQPPMDGALALDRLPAFLRRLDGEVEIHTSPELPFVLDARLHHRAPLVLRLQPDIQGVASYSGELELLMATTVRRSCPALDLRPLAWMHELTTRLRIHRDAQVGDDAFDNRFLTQAEPEAVPSLLPPEVRASLLRIARFDVPRLQVADGRALLRWRYDVTEEPIDAGARVLASLRSVDPRVRLLRQRKGGRNE